MFVDAIPKSFENVSYQTLLDEVQFETIHLDGAVIPREYTSQFLGFPEPIYRHVFAGNSVPMTSTVVRVCDYVKSKIPYDFNHVLIQHYRDGKDFIGKHSDKTLDMDEYAPIVTVSFYRDPDGPFRKMRLRNKSSKSSYDYELPDRSIFVLDLETNRNFLHEIKKMENPSPRISLTFRKINTFLVDGKLVGKGAGVLNLREGFSIENRTTEINPYKFE